MKRLFLFLSFVIITTVLMAIPAKPGVWSVITLSDGTQVSVEKVGDEHLHWLRAADGSCYTMGSNGYERADASLLQAERMARIEAKQAKRRAIYASTSDGLGKKGKMSMGSVPSIGEYTIPVVMVQFKDTKFKSTTTVEKMDRYYNEDGYSDEAGTVGSVRDYFIAQSGGQFVPTFDVVGIVTLDKNASYYGENDSWGNDKNLDQLPGHVIKAAIEQLEADFSQYSVPAADENHKAGVPLLAMFYAGKGEATESESTENKKLLWPCEWDDVEDPAGGNYEGVHFNSFFIGNEIMTVSNGFGGGQQKLMGMSVFCHEFGHAMGLPDFYCTDYNYTSDDPFGLWSIMDCGAYYNNECRLPVGYNAYEKSYMGWLELKEMNDSTTVTLQSPLGQAEGSAYIVRNSSTETFILENRQPSTWYPSSFGTGVLVSRIAYSYNAWSGNTLNNTQSKKRACVMTADGAKLYYSASKSNLYGNGKSSIGSLNTYNGKTKDIGVKGITKNSDGTITLLLKDDDPIDPDTTSTVIPVPMGSVIFYESFDQCSATGGNDGVWSGISGTSNIHADNEGWTIERGYAANACARFGTGVNSGIATTPLIALNGEAVLTFRAAAWKKDGEKTNLLLTAEGGTVSPSTITLQMGEWTDYEALVTATEGVRITIASAAKASNRFFLDEVKLTNVEAGTDAIEALSQEAQPQVIYDLLGRRVQHPTRGLYIVNGRKVMVK